MNETEKLLAEAERQMTSTALTDGSITSARRVFTSAEAAVKAFARFHRKLLDVELWNAHSEISSFQLFEPSGNARGRQPARDGDYIKVTLPGSGKDDWIKIVKIYESPNEIVLTVQPAHDPTNAENAEIISHFFIADSTNNFCLQKQNSTINFYVIGLNEKTNTAETSGVLETVRNYATANIGRFLGIQKTQWQTFCDNFIEIEK